METEREPIWTEQELREMLGQIPKFVVRDSGGWYLHRKRWNRDGSCLDLTWTHNRNEARKFTKEVDAILLKNRIAVDYERATVEVCSFFE